MMNLLARILSHGFALVVVVLIAITLMYRGDLFPEWGLPEFLVIKDKSDAGTDAASGTVDRALPEAVATSPESATGVPLVAPQTEAPQTEAPQTESPQVETPQTEAPQVETPQTEAPQVETPQTEAPQVEAPQVEAPQVEAPQVEAPQVEAPQVEAPQVEAPQTEAPQVEAPQVEAPQVEAPQVEAPQVEAPQMEVIEEVVTQDVVSPVEVVVPDTVDASRETSPDAAAGEDEVAVPEPMLAEPVVTAASSSPTTAAAASAGSSDSTPDETDATVPQDVQGQAEEKRVAPPVTVTESEAVTEQFEPPLPDMVAPTPVAEPITDLPPESVAAPVTVTVTESEAVTEQFEPPLPDMAPSLPTAEPVTDPQPESVAAPVTVTVTESEVVTEQLEAPSPDMAPSIPAAEPVIDPSPESVAAAATSLDSNAGKSTYELLAAAREAYWLHDYEGAENHYQLLIQLEPDNPDWYGELGNMYFSQGQWQQASAVYYEAGVRLLNDGKVLQARQMVDVIRGLNGVEADDLENQVNAGQVAP